MVKNSSQNPNRAFFFKQILIFISVFFLFAPNFVGAVSLGQHSKFFVDKNYDLTEQEEIIATLQRIGSNAYFYVENEYWAGLGQIEKNTVKQSLNNLDNEFHNNIYPTLTDTLGSEWKPGIDRDDRIFILFHPMADNNGGYFRENDQYLKMQVPDSNEMEIIYLNTDFINSSIEKSFLAHEFTHLITFNQKNRIYGVSEEVWLNEARAEYAPTLVGYDDLENEDTNLESRVKVFLKEPNDSITGWQNKLEDYGALNIFTHYLVDHYGIEILKDSLKSEEVGIKSLEYALEKNKFVEDFSQIFTDYTIAVFINDCSVGEKYCFKNENLKDLRVSPSVNFLPINGDSNLGVSQSTKNWAGNWCKFIGGKGGLKIKFMGNPENLFRIPYVTKDSLGEFAVDFFELDEGQDGEVIIPEFGGKIKSMTIIPSIQSKKSGFLGKEISFSFFWEASTMLTEEEIEQETDIADKCLVKPVSKMNREEILLQIAEIQALLEQLRARLQEIESNPEPNPEPNPGPEPNPEPALEPDFPEDSDCEPQPACRLKGVICCSRFESNLSSGMNNDDVKCLQQLLEILGPDIYPEGLDTGYFGSLTKAAVIRFQNKFADEVLTPWGIPEGTGFVGKTTRAKLNELCEQ
jgi:peptidoglycan hydrolase-like protein with peptidoglycan-binding domain